MISEGHYAKFCEVEHYDENMLETDDHGCFGHWLRAESREWSPLWKSFYAKPRNMDDEIVPETPSPLLQLVAFKLRGKRPLIPSGEKMIEKLGLPFVFNPKAREAGVSDSKGLQQ
ncbi:hypothetical protein NL676_023477 [Syzygium grande]|nr:hypothetical protein NL676_023477 [Syzygium grande]